MGPPGTFAADNNAPVRYSESTFCSMPSPHRQETKSAPSCAAIRPGASMRWAICRPTCSAKCHWFTPDLTLVLHDYGTSILFAMGAGSIREALDHVTWPVHLQVQRDALDEMARHATVTSIRLMWRMVVEAAVAHRAIDPARSLVLARTMCPHWCGSMQTAQSSGESPDFFYPSMVTDGVFFGVYEGRRAGRRRGHASGGARGKCRGDRQHLHATGSARPRSGPPRHCRGVRDLNGIETIGLNVRADNDAAIHLYESLGFVRHCQFHEGARDQMNRAPHKGVPYELVQRVLVGARAGLGRDGRRPDPPDP